MMDVLIDFGLGLTGLLFYTAMAMAAKINRSKPYRDAYHRAGTNWKGFLAVLDKYWDDNPAAHVATFLWIVIVAFVGDMDMVTEYLPDEDGRNAITVLNGIGANAALDKMSAMFLQGDGA